MRCWLITGFLVCATIGLGIWAWQTAHQRDFEVVFAASGDEAEQWAEKAKEDRWVELVTMEIVDGQVTHVPVAHDEIDSHVRTNSSVFVRRWLPSDTAAGITGALATHGYPDMAQLAGKRVDAATGQKARATRLTISTVATGVLAVAFGIVATIRSRRARQ